MEKQTQLSYLLAGLYILSKFLHNPYYSIFGSGDYEIAKIFLLIFDAVWILFGISVLYNVITYIKKGKPQDLWKLGWLGFIGLLGLIIIPGISVLSVFMGFFGLKKTLSNS